jgi:hypothetical protein
MPNLWSNAKQAIYEAFKGPRTDDLDFESKVQELENMYISVENISNMYKNIQNHTEGLKYLYDDISQIQRIYTKDTVYSETIQMIIQTFEKLTNKYFTLV